MRTAIAVFTIGMLGAGCADIIGIGSDPVLSDHITLTGAVQAHTDHLKLADITVELVSNADAQPFAGVNSATTDADGQFVITVPRAALGAGLDAQVHIVDDTHTPPYLPVYVHPTGPTNNSGSVPGVVEMFTASELDAYAASMVSTGRTLLIFVVEDGSVARNASVTSNVSGVLRYVDDMGNLAPATATRTGALGSAYLFNLDDAVYAPMAERGGRSGTLTPGVTVEVGNIGIVAIDVM